jgi:hypothetical protein
MLAVLIALAALTVMVVGPLLWRIRQDRRAERAQVVGARARAALFRALGGDSFVAVEASAPSAWRAGRVVLSAPSDWLRLLECHWSDVAAQVPAGYELVVRPLTPLAPPRPRAEQVPLPRAA